MGPSILVPKESLALHRTTIRWLSERLHTSIVFRRLLNCLHRQASISSIKIPFEATATTILSSTQSAKKPLRHPRQTCHIPIPYTHHHFPPIQTSEEDQQRLKLSLLKDLPIRPLILLAFHLDGLVPAPLVLDKRLVLLLAGVQLGKGIALVVRGDVEGGLLLLAADDERALDDGFVGFAVDGGAAEDVFAGAFEAGEEAA